MAFKNIRIVAKILKYTGADKIIAGFLAFTLLCATVIWLIEPEIRTWFEALWYCFTVVSTIGFGDVVVHHMFSRSISVVLSIYAVLILAIFTGVVVNYFTQIVELRQQDSIAAIVDKLERLPEMSKEELTELSEKVKKLTK